MPNVDGTLSQRIYGVSEIDRFATLSPETMEDWEVDTPSNIPDKDYFVYGSKQEPYNVRIHYLKTAIALSEESANSTILLNSEIQFDSGEWEIWELSPYLAGAARLNSFYSF